MKMFKLNNMEIVRTYHEHPPPVTWLLRAQRNWNLANLYDCIYRIDFAAYLS